MRLTKLKLEHFEHANRLIRFRRDSITILKKHDVIKNRSKLGRRTLKMSMTFPMKGRKLPARIMHLQTSSDTCRKAPEEGILLGRKPAYRYKRIFATCPSLHVPSQSSTKTMRLPILSLNTEKMGEANASSFETRGLRRSLSCRCLQNHFGLFSFSIIKLTTSLADISIFWALGPSHLGLKLAHPSLRQPAPSVRRLHLSFVDWPRQCTFDISWSSQDSMGKRSLPR